MTTGLEVTVATDAKAFDILITLREGLGGGEQDNFNESKKKKKKKKKNPELTQNTKNGGRGNLR